MRCTLFNRIVPISGAIIMLFFTSMHRGTRAVSREESIPQTFAIPFQRGLWVRAASMVHPDSIERILSIATDLDITDIYAQVAVGGYAYYNSHVLPRSQYLAKVSGTDYDPLDSLTRACHKCSIRVHAWVNTLLAWSLREPPDSSRHIYFTHPEWFIRDTEMRSMIEYTYEEWVNAGLEGLYLDPSLEEVRAFLQGLCVDIANRYAVAGIHLDFIRYPGTVWGLPAIDTAALFAGTDGYSLRWLTMTRYAQLPLISRWRVWHYWHLSEIKEQHILRVVKDIRMALTPSIDNRGLILSSALFANPSLSRYRFAQHWQMWNKVIDYPLMMSYTPDMYFFNELVDYALGLRDDAIFGIGILWPDMGAEAYWQCKAVQDRNGKGVCIFDFTALDTIPDYDKVKGIGLVQEDSVFVDTLRYGTIDTPFADIPSKNIVDQGLGLLDGEERGFAEFLLSLSFSRERDLQRMDMTEKEFRQCVTRDVAAFQAIDCEIFPLEDELIKPPSRDIVYEFLPWDSGDTLQVLQRAGSLTELTLQKTLFPSAMGAITNAVFDCEIDKIYVEQTRAGVYVFKVTALQEGGEAVAPQDVPAAFLGTYKNWTLECKFRQITGHD